MAYDFDDDFFGISKKRCYRYKDNMDGYSMTDKEQFVDVANDIVHLGTILTSETREVVWRGAATDELCFLRQQLEDVRSVMHCEP